MSERYVTIGFRWTGGHLADDALRQLFTTILTPHAWIADLDMAVREIGAGGERVEDEGRWDRAPEATRTAVDGRSEAG